jgi:hypothetical protein
MLSCTLNHAPNQPCHGGNTDRVCVAQATCALQEVLHGICYDDLSLDEAGPQDLA